MMALASALIASADAPFRARTRWPYLALAFAVVTADAAPAMTPRRNEGYVVSHGGDGSTGQGRKWKTQALVQQQL